MVYSCKMHVFILIYRCCYVTPAINTLLSLKYNHVDHCGSVATPPSPHPAPSSPLIARGENSSPISSLALSPSAALERSVASGTDSMTFLYHRTQSQMQAFYKESPVFFFIVYCYEIISEVKDFVRNTWSDKIRSKSQPKNSEVGPRVRV